MQKNQLLFSAPVGFSTFIFVENCMISMCLVHGYEYKKYLAYGTLLWTNMLCSDIHHCKLFLLSGENGRGWEGTFR